MVTSQNSPMIKVETSGRASGDMIQRHRETSGKRVQKIKGVSGRNITMIHIDEVTQRSRWVPKAVWALFT